MSPKAKLLCRTKAAAYRSEFLIVISNHGVVVIVRLEQVIENARMLSLPLARFALRYKYELP